jgi:hypothetical protein
MSSHFMYWGAYPTEWDIRVGRELEVWKTV